MTMGKKLSVLWFALAAVSFVSTASAQVLYIVDGQALCGGMGGTIRRAEIGESAFAVVATNPNTPKGVAVDPPNDKLYWAEGSAIRRSSLSGTGIIDLITGQAPQDVDLDLVAGKIYWHNFSEIKRADLSGANVQTLIPGLLGGGKVALDVAGGKMYWTAVNTNPRRIDRANLDGTNVQPVVSVASPHSIDGLAVDGVNGKLYWTSFSLAKIQQTNLDGTSPVDIITGVSVGDIAVDTLHSKIFYRQTGGGPPDRVRRANLDGTGAVDAVTGLSLIVSIAMDVLGDCENGDLNCDGTIDGDDIPLFVQKLLNG